MGSALGWAIGREGGCYMVIGYRALGRLPPTDAPSVIDV